MFQIITNSNSKAEKLYTFHTIFHDYLNITHSIKWDNSLENTILIFNERKLVSEDFIFKNINNNFLKPCSIPDSDSFIFFTVKNLLNLGINLNRFPVCSSKSFTSLYFVKEDNTFLNFDIFGLIFMLLSRYEEYVYSDVSDYFGRFPFSKSFLSRKNLIKYPIVDIYVLFLSRFFKIKLPKINNKISVTFDLDAPVLKTKPNFKHNLRCLFRDTFIWRCPLSGIKKFYNNLKISRLYHFKKINYLLKRHNYKGIFYLLVDKIHKHDGTYSLDDENIKYLIKYLLKEGHQIGLHFSFTASNNFTQLRSEVKKFKDFLFQFKKKEIPVISRFHILRIHLPTHLEMLAELGIKNDSSLCFAEETGFRCGTAFSYPAYSVLKRRKLNISLTPLVIMDVSYTSEKYMNLDHSDPKAFADAKALIDRSFNSGTTSCILFHDNWLLNKSTLNLYKKILSL